MDRPSRPSKPRPDPAPVVRILRTQHGRVRCEGPTIGSRVCHHEPRAARACIPAPVSCQLTRQPKLAIQGAHRLVQIHELSFELDREHGPRRRMPRKDVDDPSLAVDRERDLGFEDPRTDRHQMPSHGLMHGGVARIQQAPKIAALPTNRRVKPRAKGVGHPSDPFDGNRPEVTAFDPADHLTRHGRPASHIALTPSPSNSNGAKGCPDLAIVHDLASLLSATWRAVTCHNPP